MSSLCIIRKGHLGDVILTEPIAREFKKHFDSVYLCTEYLQTEYLLANTYDGFIPYSQKENLNNLFDKVLVIIYETHPDLHYIDAYAKSVGITLSDKMPRIRTGNPKTIEGDYCLIAPFTSYWIKAMRQWPLDNYMHLKRLMEERYNLKVIMLDEKYSFMEMISLIESCTFFVGNDSGPAIISQCYGRNSFIIFGATHPNAALFGSNATSISINLDCIGCKHFTRHTEIECATPLCIQELPVHYVFRFIKSHFDNT